MKHACREIHVSCLETFRYRDKTCRLNSSNETTTANEVQNSTKIDAKHASDRVDVKQLMECARHRNGQEKMTLKYFALMASPRKTCAG